MRDLFYPVEAERVRHPSGPATRIGRDVGKGEILLLDSGEVIFCGEGEDWFVNSSLEQYRDALLLVVPSGTAAQRA